MMPQSLALVASLFALPVAAFAVQPGDTRDAVIAELGAPNGSATAGDRVVMYYDRGTVQLHDGRVAAVNLVSVDELAAREAKEAAAIVRMDEATQARRARLEVEGQAIYTVKNADASFAALPADTQLGYWRQFATRFPMISVENEIAPLADKVDQEIRLREVEAVNAARLAALETRLAETEERADRAESYARYNRYDRYGAGSSFLFYPPRHRHMSDRPSRRHDDLCGPDRSPRLNAQARPATRSVSTAPVQAYMNADEVQRRAFKVRAN